MTIIRRDFLQREAFHLPRWSATRSQFHDKQGTLIGPTLGSKPTTRYQREPVRSRLRVSGPFASLQGFRFGADRGDRRSSKEPGCLLLDGLTVSIWILSPTQLAQPAPRLPEKSGTSRSTRDHSRWPTVDLGQPDDNYAIG
ncbi:MAG: hypothetical protein F4Z65_09600 [Acidobacteria bacterium]|nr:hypothetical protein [Acidobacteriota bacterium]